MATLICLFTSARYTPAMHEVGIKELLMSSPLVMNDSDYQW